MSELDKSVVKVISSALFAIALIVLTQTFSAV